MAGTNFIAKLKNDHDRKEKERRLIISLSNEALYGAKKAIFSVHRGDLARAEETLREMKAILLKLEKEFGFKRILEEGAYKAGVEEYVEAEMFFAFVSGRALKEIKGIKIEAESYFAGICDLVGEMARLAVNRVAAGGKEEAGKIKKVSEDIMAELTEVDLRGYLRVKYDQAKTSLKKIEQVNYDIEIRSKDF